MGESPDSYVIKKWILPKVEISLVFNFEFLKKEAKWIVRLKKENFEESRIYKTRNAAMNFVRNFKNKFDEKYI